MTVSCTTSCASASVRPALSATPWISRQYVSKNRCQLAWSSTSHSRPSKLARVEIEASVLKRLRIVVQGWQAQTSARTGRTAVFVSQVYKRRRWPFLSPAWRNQSRLDRGQQRFYILNLLPQCRPIRVVQVETGIAVGEIDFSEGLGNRCGDSRKIRLEASQ